jgi:hypothetical protein
MDPLGGWTTARRCPRTPDRGSAPVKRHSRIAVAGEQPHPRPRMGRSRRQTHRTTPNSWDRGPSARRGTAPLISPPTEEVGSDSPDRGSRHLAPSRPPRHRAEHSPVPIPSPKWAAPAAHKHWAARRPTPGKRQPTWGRVLDLVRLYSGASRAGAALAHSATPPPPSTPSSKPRPGSHSSGGHGRGGHSPAAPAGAGSIPAPFGDRPASDGTQTRPRPPVPGHVGPALIQQLYRTDARNVT